MPRSESSSAFAAGAAPAAAGPISASVPRLARLQIHATDASEGGGVLSLLLHRLHASAVAAMRRRPPERLCVRIDDLQGRRFFTSDEVRELIDLALPAGTYHVNVRNGHQQRRYTVTLENGSTVDLHVGGMTDHR
jgi:hypothetical protein